MCVIQIERMGKENINNSQKEESAVKKMGKREVVCKCIQHTDRMVLCVVSNDNVQQRNGKKVQKEEKKK